MPVVSVTRGRIGRRRHVAPFAWLSLRAGLQARRSPGYLGGSMRVTRGPVFWTVSLWEDGRAMIGFRDSGVHAKSMPYLARWSAAATFATWRTDRLPAWEEAERELDRKGYSPLGLTEPVHLGARGLTLPLPPPRR